MRLSTLSGTVTRPADTTQYAAGDVIAAGTQATIPFSGLPSIAGRGALLHSAIITSSAAQATKLDGELWLFSSNITDLDADNAAFTPTDAQLNTLVGIIAFPVASWKAGDATSGANGNSACVATSLGIAVPHDNLYGVLIARNTYTPVSAEIFKVTLNVIQDY